MDEEFKPIQTKEELDALISAAVGETQKKYEGYISPDEVQKTADRITELEKSVGDLTAQNKAYALKEMRVKAAHEKGLPIELADRLSGEDEKSLAADAEKLAAFFKHSTTTPKYTGDDTPKGADSEAKAALKAVLSELTGK